MYFKMSFDSGGRLFFECVKIKVLPGAQCDGRVGIFFEYISQESKIPIGLHGGADSFNSGC